MHQDRPQGLLPSLLRFVFKRWFRLDLSGLQHLQQADPKALLIANHSSCLDVLLLALFLPANISYAMQASYCQQWWIKGLRRWINIIPLQHDDALAIKQLVQHLKEGHRLLVFPEGRVSLTGTLMKLYPGYGMLADKAQADIIPIHIHGSQYSFFSSLQGSFRRQYFPHIRLRLLAAQKLHISASYTGHARRLEADRQLSKIMYDMVYNCTQNKQQRLWDAVLEAMNNYGRKHPILEDVQGPVLRYQQLILRAFLLGALFRPHLKPKETIGLLLPNVSATSISLLGLLSQGAVVAMLNYSMGKKILIAALQTAQIKTLISSHRFIDKANLSQLIEDIKPYCRIIYLEELSENISIQQKMTAWWQSLSPKRYLRKQLQDIAANDPAIVLFTSGSEAMPKAVVLSHQNILANVTQIRTQFAFSQDDVCLMALPLFHSFGMTGGIWLPLLSGMRCYLYPSPLHYRNIPETAYQINATVLVGTNSFLYNYAKHAHPYDFHAMRYVIAGAEKLQSQTQQLWMHQFGLRIFEGYGATEASPVLAANNPMAYKQHTVGRLLPHIQYRLEPIEGIEDGALLWVKGPNIMLGYMHYQKAGVLQPLKDGWYSTGDIVSIDQEGYLNIIGRIKRFAKIAGEMIALNLIEDMANACWPHASHIALAMSHPKKGEQVVLMTTLASVQRASLQTYAKQQGMSELYLPKIYCHIDKPPLLSTGKINYPAAQRLLEKQLEEPAGTRMIPLACRH